jgi:hypothetical protein
LAAVEAVAGEEASAATETQVGAVAVTAAAEATLVVSAAEEILAAAAQAIVGKRVTDIAKRAWISDPFFNGGILD